MGSWFEKCECLKMFPKMSQTCSQEGVRKGLRKAVRKMRVEEVSVNMVLNNIQTNNIYIYIMFNIIPMSK